MSKEDKSVDRGAGRLGLRGGERLQVRYNHLSIDRRAFTIHQPLIYDTTHSFTQTHTPTSCRDDPSTARRKT
jgi:hypothetical protein